MVNLGSLIKTWREQAVMSRQGLAQGSGVSLNLLQQLEDGLVESIDSRQLAQIANHLNLPTLDAYTQLMRAGEPRRFRGYCVGLIKTGTTSMARTFSGYRSAHEFLGKPGYEMLEAVAEGRQTELDLRAFLRHRDRCGTLEMDSAGFHHHWIGSLVAEFPDARFVLTIRDCYSWLDSVVSYLFNTNTEGGDFRGWGARVMGLPFDLPYQNLCAREQLKPLVHLYLPSLLKYWQSANQVVLATVPAHRLLVVRTHELSDNFNRIADFLDAEQDQLVCSEQHARKGTPVPGALSQLSRTELRDLFRRVQQPLMDQFFPEFTLETGLADMQTHR